MEKRLSAHDATFDAPVDESDDEAWKAPASHLQDHQAVDPAKALESADWEATQNSLLTNALASLDERSQDILRQRWLSEDKATLHELAEKYSVSAERIRQIESAAMKKMKMDLSS